MDTRITIGISACLVGRPTRYDGGHRLEQGLLDLLAGKVTLVPLCPEAGCGLAIPREPMRLEGDPEKPSLLTVATRRDLTEQLLSWTARRLDALADEAVDGLILKARSPSCGKRVAVHGAGETAYRPGLFAREVMERFPALPIADEEELRYPERLADFLARLQGKPLHPAAPGQNRKNK